MSVLSDAARRVMAQGEVPEGMVESPIRGNPTTRKMLDERREDRCSALEVQITATRGRRVGGRVIRRPRSA